MMSTAAYCAKQAHKAIKGAGTDEETLVEVVCSRSREEVLQIAAAYLAGTNLILLFIYLITTLETVEIVNQCRSINQLMPMN